jgi:hypothetical protein
LCHKKQRVLHLYYLPNCSLFIHSWIHSFIHGFIHSFIHAFIHSFIHSFIHQLIHSFIHSFFNLFILLFFLSFILSLGIGPERGKALSSHHMWMFIPSVHPYVRTSVCFYVHPYVCPYLRPSVPPSLDFMGKEGKLGMGKGWGGLRGGGGLGVIFFLATSNGCH